LKTVNEAITPVFITLNGDSTLQGHLGSSGRVIKAPTRPNDLAPPVLTLRLLPAGILGEQSALDESLLWINLYLTNNSDGTPNMVLAGTIESRIETLIGDKYLTNSGTTVHPYRYLPGRLLPVDPEAKNEHIWNFQYRIVA